MNDFALVMTLLGLIAFSALFVYFFIWREPPRWSRAAEHGSERKEVGTQ